jgi:hypothetical protein
MTPTPEQMAKEIVETLILDMDSRVWTEEDEKRILSIIAAVLRSYGEACAFEANKKTMKRELSLQAIAVKNARRSALLEAAKVAESCGWVYHLDGYENTSGGTGKCIADSIRALLPPEEDGT